MSSRAGLRFLQSSRLVRDSFRKPIGRRYQTIDATVTPSQGFVSKMWNSPVGIKTVHFWAPVMKWSIVLAGVSDFARPAENLSLTQNVALTATGIIWTRWCFIIKPRNVLWDNPILIESIFCILADLSARLAAVNFFLGCVGVTQVTRILLYQRTQQGKPAAQIAEEDAKDVAGTAKGVVQDPEGAAKNALN